MKYKFLCILSIVAVIFGCTKSQIQDRLKARHYANKYPVVTIISIDHHDKNFAECLQNELREDIPNLNIIPEVKFRNALFPWFEYSTAPKKIVELSNLFSKAFVRERIENIGIEILISVHGNTEQKEYDGFMPVFASGLGYGGAYGYISADRATNITTTVWDFKESVSIGDTDVHVKGKMRWLGLIIPVPIPAFTETTACKETAKRISNCLTGKDPITNK